MEYVETLRAAEAPPKLLAISVAFHGFNAVGRRLSKGSSLRPTHEIPAIVRH